MYVNYKDHTFNANYFLTEVRKHKSIKKGIFNSKVYLFPLKLKYL